MAWRETRAAKAKFLFVVLSVALGTTALTAVTGFNESVSYTLLREARSLMGADIAIRMPVEPSPEETKFIESLEARGFESTQFVRVFVETVRQGARNVEAVAGEIGRGRQLAFQSTELPLIGTIDARF